MVSTVGSYEFEKLDKLGEQGYGYMYTKTPDREQDNMLCMKSRKIGKDATQ